MIKDVNKWLTRKIKDLPRDEIVRLFCEDVFIENYTFHKDDHSTMLSCTWTLPDNSSMHCYYNGDLTKNQECTIFTSSSDKKNTFEEKITLAQIRANVSQLSFNTMRILQLPEDCGSLVLKALVYHSFLQLF